MNNPKIFVAAFAVSCLILFALLKLVPISQPETFDGVVTNQTLTQSLDGHRLFLNVTTNEQQELLVQADPKMSCPTGSKVVIAQESALISDLHSYRLVECLPQQ